MLEGVKKGTFEVFTGDTSKPGTICRYWGCDNGVNFVTPRGMAICNEHKEQIEQCIDELGYHEEEGQCYQCEQIKFIKLRPQCEGDEQIPLCHDCYEDLFFK